jgi:hypothetical protein
MNAPTPAQVMKTAAHTATLTPLCISGGLDA